MFRCSNSFPSFGIIVVPGLVQPGRRVWDELLFAAPDVAGGKGGRRVEKPLDRQGRVAADRI